LECYVEPLTLPCGHSLCRLCMIEIHSKCDKKCPLCKTVCSGIDVHHHPPSVVVKNAVQCLFGASEIEQRVEQLEKAKAKLKRNVPCFILNMVRFPGSTVSLHLFEPRYLHMVHRAISSGNRFAYCCKLFNDNGSGYQPYEQDIVGLIKIGECEFLPDGRCLLEGVVEERVQVQSAWVERGTQGLWFVNFETYSDHERCDESCGIEGAASNDQSGSGGVSSRSLVPTKHVDLIQRFERGLYSQPNRVIQAIESECGRRVTLTDHNVERWSFWVCGLIWILGKEMVNEQWLKQQMHCRCSVQRVKACYEALKTRAADWSEDSE